MLLIFAILKALGVFALIGLAGIIIAALFASEKLRLYVGVTLCVFLFVLMVYEFRTGMF